MNLHCFYNGDGHQIIKLRNPEIRILENQEVVFLSTYQTQRVDRITRGLGRITYENDQGEEVGLIWSENLQY